MMLLLFWHDAAVAAVAAAFADHALHLCGLQGQGQVRLKQQSLDITTHSDAAGTLNPMGQPGTKITASSPCFGRLFSSTHSVCFYCMWMLPCRCCLQAKGVPGGTSAKPRSCHDKHSIATAPAAEVPALQAGAGTAAGAAAVCSWSDGGILIHLRFSMQTGLPTWQQGHPL